MKAPTILVRDFNLHHPRWNTAADPTKISKAQPLVHWLDRHKAKLLVCAEEINEHGGTLLRQNLKRTSVIDLAFSFCFRKFFWTNWRFLPPSGSDHEVITFDAIFSHTPTSSSTQNNNMLSAGFNHKKADWDKFQQVVKENLRKVPIPQTITISSMDRLAQAFTTTITTAADATMPRIRPCERSKPWWTEDLNKLRKALHKGLRIYKKSRSIPDHIAWKRTRNQYFHAIREAKTQH